MDKGLDAETKKIIGEERWLADLVGHEGWKIARRILLAKIALLQDAFEVDDSSPEKMIIDLQSRKAAVLLLKEFLREVEGSVAVVKDNKPMEKSCIVNREE